MTKNSGEEDGDCLERGDDGYFEDLRTEEVMVAEPCVGRACVAERGPPKEVCLAHVVLQHTVAVGEDSATVLLEEMRRIRSLSK